MLRHWQFIFSVNLWNTWITLYPYEFDCVVILTSICVQNQKYGPRCANNLTSMKVGIYWHATGYWVLNWSVIQVPASMGHPLKEPDKTVVPPIRSALTNMYSSMGISHNSLPWCYFLISGTWATIVCNGVIFSSVPLEPQVCHGVLPSHQWHLSHNSMPWCYFLISGTWATIVCHGVLISHQCHLSLNSLPWCITFSSVALEPQ